MAENSADVVKPAPVTKRQFASTEGSTGNKPPTGYIETLIHLVKGYVGTGVFALGQAFDNSGIIFGPICLCIVGGILNLNCHHMLIDASKKIAETEEVEVRPTFTETVRYTFEDCSVEWLQKWSRKISNTSTAFVLITEYGFCCVYFLFVADHFREVAAEYDVKFTKYEMMAIILAPMWLSTFLGSLRLLTPLSLLANILMWAGMIIIFYYCGKGIEPLKDQKLFAYKELPLFFGTVLFSYVGITFILPMRSEMKDQTKFDSPTGVLNIGFLIVTLIFCSVGVMSYWRYGEAIESSVFLNLPKSEKFAIATKILISIAIVCTFTLHMYIPFEIGYPLFYERYGPFKHPILVMCVYRSVPVLITYILANCVPFLGLFISLVGASTAAVVSLILPPVLELAAFQGQLSRFRIVKAITIITIGAFGAVSGTILTIYDIVMAFKEHKNLD